MPKKLVTAILLSSLLLVPTIYMFSSAKLPQIESYLITSKSDYKKFGYNNVEEPYIYRQHVLSDAHLPIAIKISKLQPVARGFLKHIIAKQIGKFRQIKIEYLILVNQSYTIKTPIYSTRQKTIMIHNNQTGENETKIINETYISGYKDEIRYKYVWKPINKATLKRLEPDKYYIFDIHGIIKPSTGRFSVDIVPEFNFGGNRIQLKQFAWWDSNWQYRKKMVIANASNNYQMKITVYKNDGYDDPASATIDCEGHCRDDFGDIRFANETSELSYWIEEVNNSNYSIIWVKLPSDIESQTEKYIYMYYGNPSATTTSDGNDTFILFFDGTFDPTSQFTTVERTNGWLHQITIPPEPSLLFEGKFKLNSIDARNWAGSQAIIFSNQNGTSIFDDDNTNIRFYYNTDNSASETSPGVRLYAENENTASSSSRTTELNEGNTYIYKLYLLSSTKARFETYNMDNTLNFYKEVTTNIPDEDMTTFAFDNHDYHNDNGGGSSGDIFTYDSNGYIIWKSRGSHYSSTDSWIEHYIYWYRLRKYVSIEPTWSSFESEEVGLKPQFSNILPENGATGVVPTFNQGVNTSAYISQRNGKAMNITFYWNDSGTWKSYASWTNVGNGTYYAWNANFTELNTTYEWAINASNYGEPQNYTNQTYSFTTLDDVLPAWFIANEDSTSITLDWGTSPQADSYYIRYDTTPHSTWTPTTGILLVNTTSTSYTHTGLTAGTTYYYALFIWNNTYGYSTEYKEDHTNTPYTSPNVVISNVSPSDGQIHVDIANNPPDPGGYVHITFDLNDTDGGDDMEYWLYIFDWQTNTWINRIHLTNQANQTVTQDETTFNTTGTYYYYRICTLEGGQYNNITVKFLTDRKPTQPIAINPLNNSIISDELIPLKVAVYHPDYEYGWTGLEFDGANDNVRVPDDPSLNLTSSFTIDFAIWIDTLPADDKFDVIISKMTNANTGWGIAIYNDGGNAELMICVNGHNQTVGTAQLQPHTWLYLTVVFDNTTHTMYVYQNGTEVYNYTEPNTPSANTADVVIGECSYVGNDKTLDGRMDYIRVYNVALTPDEIMANFYGKNDQCVKRGLVSWWKFDENTGTTASDSWGSNDGTLEDGVAWVTGSSTTSSYYVRVHNVSFYTYPGNKLIGYNYSASGFDNGEIVTCNTTYYAPYDGTDYYWYAVAYDDEYNTSSPVFTFSTYYNDTTTTAYYPVEAQIFVESYTDTEPNTAYYFLNGANITVYETPTIDYPVPENGSTDVPLNTYLKVYSYKTGEQSEWEVRFYTNNTVNGSWVQTGTTQTITLGSYTNNLTVNDTISSGTFYHTTTNESGLILSKQTAEKTNTNYNSNWQYYQELKIDNNGYTGYYQMQLNVSYNSGGDISCNGHCNQNFSDLRFVQVDNTTELPYWIEEKVDGSYALVWVNVSSQAMSDGKVLMYYGNPNAPPASNANSVFLFFEDMETWSGWTQYNGGAVSQDSTRVYDGTYSAHKTGNNDPAGAYKAIGTTLGRDIILEFMVNRNSDYSGGSSDRVGLIDNNGNGYGWLWTHGSSPSIGIDVRSSYTGTSNKLSVSNDYMDTWMFARLIIKSDGTIEAYAYVGGALVSSHSLTDNTYSTFTRFYIFGGYDYWVDQVIIRKYSETEPTWNISAPYHTSGYRQSPEYSLSGRAKSTKITWNSTEPSGTSISVYYNLYNGATWSGWQLATNGESISGISDGTLLDDYKIKFNISLSTTDTSKTPILHNLTLNIDRYKEAQISFSNLQYGNTYYWYATIINTTYMDDPIQTDIYHFTTMLTEPEPDTAYYPVEAQIFIESYTDTEPNTAYYFLNGANITVYTVCSFYNPQPNNTMVDFKHWEQSYVTLSIGINRTGNTNNFTIEFLSNNTGAWEVKDTKYAQIPPNATITSNLYNIDYNKTYYWKVKVTSNESGMSQESPIYSFSTMPYPPYTDTEPNTAYYPVEAQIFVEDIPDPEPDTAYYTLEAEIPIGMPSASDPFPADGSTFGQHAISQFSVYVTDPNTPTLTVTFYDASTNTAWYSTTVSNNSRAYAPKPSMTNGTWFYWYVTVDDGSSNITSSTWSYKPENQPPQVWLKPQDGDMHVQVKRKLVTGEWKYFVRLIANVTDPEYAINSSSSSLHITIYVDDPSQPNWNDWIMRLNLEDTGNGIYTQDEELFNETLQTYHWRFYVSDGYTSQNYYINFTTEFFFWSYFTYYPADPTQEDTVHFIDQSVNATDIAWYINGERVAYQNYTSGNHEPFNLTYRFMPGIYNITLWIHNDTCNNIDIWYENITVDWNVTLNTTQGGAGINYIAPPLSTNASHLASLLLRNGEWIHKYNSTTESWESIWMYKNSTIGDNFKINEWDGLAVVVGTDRKVRINISEPTNTTQNKTVDKGYHYIGWSDTDELISVNASQIGLQTGDWIFLYDTKNATWYGYRVNFAGDTFTIKPHHVIVVNVGGQRHIHIPPGGG